MQADIDILIAPLILEMWKAGIETYQSCQGNPEGWIWLQFLDQLDLARFLNLVGHHGDGYNHLHERIEYGYGRRDKWWYKMVVSGLSVDEIEKADGSIARVPTGPPDFDVISSLHFPSADLSIVLHRLRAHNTRGHTPVFQKPVFPKSPIMRENHRG